MPYTARSNKPLLLATEAICRERNGDGYNFAMRIVPLSEIFTAADPLQRRFTQRVSRRIRVSAPQI